MTLRKINLGPARPSGVPWFCSLPAYSLSSIELPHRFARRQQQIPYSGNAKAKRKRLTGPTSTLDLLPGSVIESVLTLRFCVGKGESCRYAPMKWWPSRMLLPGLTARRAHRVRL